MAKLRIKNISDIKSLDDLKHLKLKKQYELDLKKVELHASLIQIQVNLDPENLKQTVLFEANSYLQELAMKYAPGFILNFLAKRGFGK